jgi:small subunit ribosomal protein S16
VGEIAIIAAAGSRRLAAGQSRDDSKEFAERNKNPVLMIRLARFGARKQPYYRVVVIEKDRARNGRSIEVVGTYNPRTNPASVLLKKDRIDHWTGNGAQLSDRVAKLLKSYQETPAPAPAA